MLPELANAGRVDRAHDRLSQLLWKLIAKPGIALPFPSVVKIDVEGAEIEVLSGAKRLIEEVRPRFIVEVGAGADSADEWNRETKVTLSAAVEVPGHVLEAGRYVFKLADSQSDRDIVQIFSGDRRELIATILAVQTYRLEPTDDTVITLEERRVSSPEAIGKWFYPGELEGCQP